MRDINLQKKDRKLLMNAVDELLMKFMNAALKSNLYD